VTDHLEAIQPTLLKLTVYRDFRCHQRVTLLARGHLRRSSIEEVLDKDNVAEWIVFLKANEANEDFALLVCGPGV
jgi:hypothetical protein